MTKGAIVRISTPTKLPAVGEILEATPVRSLPDLAKEVGPGIAGLVREWLAEDGIEQVLTILVDPTNQNFQELRDANIDADLIALYDSYMFVAFEFNDGTFRDLRGQHLTITEVGFIFESV